MALEAHANATTLVRGPSLRSRSPKSSVVSSFSSMCRTTRPTSWASSSQGATPPSWSSEETRISSPGRKPRAAVRDSAKFSEVMFVPKITSWGAQPRKRDALTSASSRIAPTRRLVAYPAPRFALASRSARAIASPTSSGTWVPPGASRNVKPARDEKRPRTAVMSRLERRVSVIGGFLSGSGTGQRLDFDRITTVRQTSKPFPCRGLRRDGLITTLSMPGEGVPMKASVIVAATALGALAVAGCGSSSSSGGGGSNASGATKSCVASVGMEGPLTGPVAVLGQEQLHFAQLALASDNLANKTKISIVQGDTQLNPAQATTVTQQFTSNSKIVAVVGPAGSQEVEAIGPLMARAGLAFISGSATNKTLTTGKYPTFLRTVSNDSVQGPQDAHYIISNLHPKAVMIVDDQEVYSTGLVSSMIPIFQAAGIKVDHESVSQKVTDFSSLVAKVTPATTVVVLPWQIAANAQQFGRNLAQQHKKALIFGTDGLFSPGTFTINGSYVSSFGPDITAIPADAAIVAAAKAKYGSFGTFGPPVFAATHVVDDAIASVCKSGQTPSRANVLAAIKNTNEATTILGQPIKFTSSGDVVNGKFFLFKIDSTGKYNLIPG